MAQNTTITIDAETWTLLTNSNVTEARVFNSGSNTLYVQATVGTTPPSTTSGAIALRSGDGFAADLTLEQLFPGVAGANRLYGYSPRSCPVSVSHA